MVVVFQLAQAQEPETPEPAAPEPAEPEPAEPVDPPYEVTVYGELLVEQAREKVVERMEDLGYTAKVIDRGDHVVYRHETPWHGEVVLHDDGWMQVKRQPLYVEGRAMPWAKRNTPLAWAGCVAWPYLCLRTTGATLTHRKWLGMETRTVDELAPDVRSWGDRVADLATSRTVDALPDRLTALWEQGVPLQGDGPALQTAAERRAALHAFWASRTDTVWGREVQQAVEAFCRAVVQTSEAPFTAEELAAYAAERPERPFLAPPRPEPVQAAAPDTPDAPDAPRSPDAPDTPEAP
jgi:hypothetical protein